MNLKRTAVASLAALIAVLITSITMTLVVSAAGTAKPDDKAVNPGTTGFLIPVVFTGVTEEISSYDFEFLYDSSVINITGATLGMGITNYTLISNAQTGRFLMVGFYLGFGDPLTGDFTFLNLTANAVGGAGASTTLTLNIRELTTNVGAAISVAASPATISIVNDEVTVGVPMRIGFNMIGIPVDIGIGTARYSDIAASITSQGGNVLGVSAWHPLSQTFTTWSAAAPLANDNLVQLGEGYFVQLSVPPDGGEWNVTGTPINAPVSLDFQTGFNLIAIPFSATTYRNSELAVAINAAAGSQVTTILSWNPSLQAFINWSASAPAANDNTVDTQGRSAYFIRTSATVSSFTP